MVMRKVIKSNVPMILFKNSNDSTLFPPGFRFRIGSIVYTVKADCTQEDSSPMREVFLSDGRTEIVPIEVLVNDIKEISKDSNLGEIMEPDERFSSKKSVPVSDQKKILKKKTKKTKKSKNKYGN